MIDVLDTPNWSPQQALLKAMEVQDEIEAVAIVFIKKDEDKPRAILSSMNTAEVTYLGFALQSMALE